MTTLSLLRARRKEIACAHASDLPVWGRRTLLIVSALLMPYAVAEDVQFDNSFLPAGSSGIDLTLFQSGNPVMSGTY
ncbi:MAG: hypothetical protein ACRESN_08520, partial [Pseudomonas sp.]